jgi:hypothetical protein
MHGATTALAFLRQRLRVITAAGSIMLVVFGVLLATGEIARLSARLNVVSLPI